MDSTGDMQVFAFPSSPLSSLYCICKMGSIPDAKLKDVPGINCTTLESHMPSNPAEQNQPGPMPKRPAGHLLLLFLNAFNYSPTEVVQKSPYFHAPSTAGVSSHENVDLSSSLMHFAEAISVKTQRCPSLCKVYKDSTDGHSEARAGDNAAVTDGHGTAQPRTEVVLAASANIPMRNPKGLVFTTALFIGKQLNLFKQYFSLFSEVSPPSATSKALSKGWVSFERKQPD